jgi:lipoprotein-anchoring transpeptidase ErfK/SrfK
MLLAINHFCAIHIRGIWGRGTAVNDFRIACAGAMAWTLGAFGGLPSAAAMEGWSSDGRLPVFESDLLREQERQQHDRATTYHTKYPAFMEGGGQPEIAPLEPPVVELDKPERPGTIIIDTHGRRLLYVLPGEQAYQYPISVGRLGFTWTGTERISRIAAWPTWTPPPEMIVRQPWLPRTMTGGINNPLGAKALYLGQSVYRIHGTNDPKSIGFASSSGCFRMMNGHVMHLATLAGIGTEVRVVSRY